MRSSSTESVQSVLQKHPIQSKQSKKISKPRHRKRRSTGRVHVSKPRSSSKLLCRLMQKTAESFQKASVLRDVINEQGRTKRKRNRSSSAKGKRSSHKRQRSSKGNNVVDVSPDQSASPTDHESVSFDLNHVRSLFNAPARDCRSSTRHEKSSCDQLEGELRGIADIVETVDDIERMCHDLCESRLMTAVLIYSNGSTSLRHSSTVSRKPFAVLFAHKFDSKSQKMYALPARVFNGARSRTVRSVRKMVRELLSAEQPSKLIFGSKLFCIGMIELIGESFALENSGWVDPQLAAWLCDPDCEETKNFEFPELVDFYCDKTIAAPQ
eukprot:8894_1